jgi:transcriptional regulator with XRE-family HTH domain
MEMARGRTGMSKREFHRRLLEELPEQTKGRSYGSIHHYLEGNREPPLEVLTAAAKVLEVTPEYLLGLTDKPKGHRLPPEPLDPAEHPFFAALEEAVEKSWVKEASGGDGHIPMAFTYLILDACTLGIEHPEDEGLTADHAQLLVNAVDELIGVPLELLRGGGPITWRELKAYTTAMLHALSLALPPAPGKVPTSDILAGLARLGAAWSALADGRMEFGEGGVPRSVPEERRAELVKWIDGKEDDDGRT